jgi:hypothetical protein
MSASAGFYLTYKQPHAESAWYIAAFVATPALPGYIWGRQLRKYLLPPSGWGFWKKCLLHFGIAIPVAAAEFWVIVLIYTDWEVSFPYGPSGFRHLVNGWPRTWHKLALRFFVGCGIFFILFGLIGEYRPQLWKQWERVGQAVEVLGSVVAMGLFTWLFHPV